MSSTLSPPLDAGGQSWYSGLAPNEKRTFWACFGGWALDAFDVQILSFAIPAIVATFSITNIDAGLIGTVTLLTSALVAGLPVFWQTAMGE
jgi:MFS family permease